MSTVLGAWHPRPRSCVEAVTVAVPARDLPAARPQLALSASREWCAVADRSLEDLGADCTPLVTADLVGFRARFLPAARGEVVSRLCSLLPMRWPRGKGPGDGAASVLGRGGGLGPLRVRLFSGAHRYGVDEVSSSRGPSAGETFPDDLAPPSAWLAVGVGQQAGGLPWPAAVDPLPAEEPAPLRRDPGSRLERFAVPGPLSTCLVVFPGVRLTDERKPAVQALCRLVGASDGLLVEQLRDAGVWVYSLTFFSRELVAGGYVGGVVRLPGQRPELVDAALRQVLERIAGGDLAPRRLAATVGALAAEAHHGAAHADETSVRLSTYLLTGAQAATPAQLVDQLQAVTALQVREAAAELLTAASVVRVLVGSAAAPERPAGRSRR